ncbi:ATP synthase subunit B isoform X2 [Tasmannia lanceolata]|uniref:ATP synthase subunit B isoform X2 n=1 Tax=Tasmannia lanceolata TaxID=3420 RepID=UPI0040642D99
MEALRKLENVQRMLSFVQSSGLSSNNNDSDRFLSNFLLFMVQPCDTLNVEKRCNLVSENLPKISAAILEEALLWVNGEDHQQSCVELPAQLYLDNKQDQCLFRSNVDDMAMIELDAMQRSNSTLEDFCRSYFMFHGMDVNKPQSIFRFLPVLSFTESYIYQLDSFNEEILNLSMKSTATERGPNFLSDTSKVDNQRVANHFPEPFKSDPFRPLVLQLERLGLLTERITTELSFGTEYWALERKLCKALIIKNEIFSEDVMRAIHLKSFDYRVLNLLLYQLTEQQVNDMHMEFLSISEFLVEVSDDLFDYEDDVIENNFNILRMFIGLYGASTAPSELAKCITEAEEKYERLLNALDPDLSQNYKRRCEEATREGGNTSGHSLGTWTIPPVIADEEFYRSRFLSSKSTVPPT